MRDASPSYAGALSPDICVVGSGPVGMALALALAENGRSVLLLESGLATPQPFPASLSSGHSVDARRHASPDVAICRALGGASRWWGGRCVPFEPLDLEPRPHVPETRWPLAYEDVAQWYPSAARFFAIGRAEFSDAGPPEGFADLDVSGLERWAPSPDLGACYKARLAGASPLTVCPGVTVTGLHPSADGARIDRLEVAEAGTRRTIAPRQIVLACGGLETTRLLLALQAAASSALGGRDGPLGRFYMGHLSGRIADIVFADPRAATAFDFVLDDGVFLRRRLTVPRATQRREHLLNTAFWVDNPPFHAADHGNGVLSLVWLALAVPFLGRRLVSEALRLSHVGPPPARVRGHLRNALRSPARTLGDLRTILTARYLTKPRKPGFLMHSGEGRYALHYHAEQAPHAESRVRLSDRLDPLGVPYLDIDLRYTEEDARSVVRSHAIVDEALRRSGKGRLAYHAGPAERMASVLDQAKDGFHQIGTARMGSDPATSVVDADCKVHGIDNLFVASSAVFPSSGQANPTFLAVALALRLADHLRARRGSRGTVVPHAAEQVA